MASPSRDLRADALRIWQAGLEAVRSERLMAEAVRVEGRWLILGNDVRELPDESHRIDLDTVKRIAVVGAGKAGAGMAAALEGILGPKLMEEKQLVGWVNVPADCVPAPSPPAPAPLPQGALPQNPEFVCGMGAMATARSGHAANISGSFMPTEGYGHGTLGLNDRFEAKPPQGERGERHPHPGPLPKGEGVIHLHAARPAGMNEPTEEGVAGTNEILRIVGSLGPDDLCIALISGGGSALMPAPIEGISLADKLAVTRFLSAAGANIAELNTVRKQLSRIKGGGLARACRANRLVALIISDIPGDPLDLIASGPTVADSSTPQDALAILKRFDSGQTEIPAAVYEALNRKAAGEPLTPALSPKERENSNFTIEQCNFIIGNNATAVDAAGQEAERLGYAHALTCANKPEGTVEPIGKHLADMALHMRGTSGPNCLICGGEGTVQLAPETERGKGGRNQQTALAALIRLQESIRQEAGAASNEIVILSGATDGEDGPTDAAGAFVDSAVMEEAQCRGLDPTDFLRRNDAYHFFEPLGALIKTGPTNTNVCDVRVVLVDRE